MELVQSLRRTEFPDDTRGALKHLERVCMAQSEANVAIPGDSQSVFVHGAYLDLTRYHHCSRSADRVLSRYFFLPKLSFCQHLSLEQNISIERKFRWKEDFRHRFDVLIAISIAERDMLH